MSKLPLSQAAPKVWPYLLVYFACAEFGQQLLFSDASLSTLWLPGGILMGAMLIVAPAGWPALLSGALTASLISKVLIHGHPLLVALPMILGGLLEALAGAILVLRVVGRRPRISQPRDFLTLIFLAALSASIISASIGTLTIALTGSLTRVLETWAVWWAADALGIMVLTPMVLAWVPDPGVPVRLSLTPAKRIELAAGCLVVLGTSLVLFYQPGDSLDSVARYPFVTVFAAALWMTVRFEKRGATLACLCVALPVVWCTTRGYGVFVLLGNTAVEQALRLQAFLASFACTLLTVAGSIERRRLAEARLIDESNELRRTEAQVREQRNLLQSMLDSMGEAVLVYNEAEELTLANPAALRLFTRRLQLETPARCFKSGCLYLEDEQTPCLPETSPLAHSLRGDEIDGTLLAFRSPGSSQSIWLRTSARAIRRDDGSISGAVVVLTDITEIRQAERGQAALVVRLQQALKEVKTLRGLIPICSQCKKIRNDEGAWERLEKYLGARTDAEFTHGMCPDCGVAMYGDLWLKSMDPSLPD